MLCMCCSGACVLRSQAVPQDSLRQPKPSERDDFESKVVNLFLFKLKIHCSITEIPETLLNSSCSHTYTIMIIYGFYISAI